MAVDEAFLKELKEVITEGHKLLKDMKAERKEYEKLFEKVRADTRSTIEEYIAVQVKTGLATYAEAMRKATNDATKAVFKRFDTLGDILMGTDDPNKESLATVIRKWKANGN